MEQLLETPGLAEGLNDYFQCRKEHAPLPCYRRNDKSPCILRPLQRAWRTTARNLPPPEDPRVFALTEAGCKRHRAQMIVQEEGWGMALDEMQPLVQAFKDQGQSLRNVGVRKASHTYQTCRQCESGTNTFAWGERAFRGDCFRIPVAVGSYSSTFLGQDGPEKVLCIGEGGELRLCGPQEYMAISHVWAHGWQGTSEDGICSRTLEMLLVIAKGYGINYIWLDVAMISGDRVIRTMAVNQMRAVYTMAKVTLVCDRLLCTMKGGSARVHALAIAASDWMTRVWTLQESILSSNLIFLFGGALRQAKVILDVLVYMDEPGRDWTRLGAIKTMFALNNPYAGDTEWMLERLSLLGHERLTTKSVDLVRAIYPLFELQWPGPETSLAEGQIRLLQHLGKHASRCANIFGPVGLPSPWSWAPLSILGVSGSLESRGRVVTSTGLMGAWAWKEVKALVRFGLDEFQGPLSTGHRLESLLGSLKASFQTGVTIDNFTSSSFPGNVMAVGSSIKNAVGRALQVHVSANWESAQSHSNAMANLTGSNCSFATFVDMDGKNCLQGMLFTSSHEDRDFPWSDARLFLLRSGSSSKVVEFRSYDLAVVRNSDGEWYDMHRVGSIFGPAILMADEKLCIQGVLS